MNKEKKHIYVKIYLPEEYEDVCNELIVEDCHIHPDFKATDCTEEIENLVRERDKARRQLCENIAVMTPSIILNHRHKVKKVASDNCWSYLYDEEK